jgi:glycosyltransferase involved in cell wall biosynthesis
MKILLINKFLYPKGGDAIATIKTGRLLESHNHQVAFWGMNHPRNPKYLHKDLFVSNVDYDNPAGIVNQVKMARNLLYSKEAKKKLYVMLKRFRPDIVHLNNFAHQLSPSILHTIKKYEIPCVMTMHDFKLVCASYLMRRNGAVCEACKDQKYFHCLTSRCVKSSALKSLLNTAEMYLHHKLMHLYDLIDLFIAPSEFMISTLRRMGFRREAVYLPNFVALNGFKPQYRQNRSDFVYFGRLSEEKGLPTLLRAVRGVPDVTLKIIGDGPIKEELDAIINRDRIRNVSFPGYLTGAKLKAEIGAARAVVLASECYENNPLALVEAFALGKPAIGSRIGGIAELVKDGITGLTFNPGDSNDLMVKLKFFRENPDEATRMGINARAFVESELDPEKYYRTLMDLYHRVLNARYPNPMNLKHIQNYGEKG